MSKIIKLILTVSVITFVTNNGFARDCDKLENDVARLACFDKAKPKSTSSASIRKQTYSKFECGDKYYCSEMKNCAEALFYLKKCGLKKLDSDGDGIPCEKLCH